LHNLEGNLTTERETSQRKPVRSLIEDRRGHVRYRNLPGDVGNQRIRAAGKPFDWGSPHRLIAQ
jgi:hypothetical protein